MLESDEMNVYCWYIISVITIFLIKQATCGTYFLDTKQLRDKVVIVTGANSGIGLQTATKLAKRGANVILACRDTKKGLAAERSIKKEARSECVRFRQLDLASLKSIRSFVDVIMQEEQSLYALVNNAGVFWCPLTRTQDGFELNFGVNHLGHFLLTLLLLPLLNNTDEGSRVVTVSSIMHVFANMNLSDLNYNNRAYNFVQAYSESKLANVMFSEQLAMRLKSNRIKTFCADPGIVFTDIGRNSFIMNSFVFKILLRPLVWLLFKDANAGAQTTLYCVCSDDVADDTGKFYSECEQRHPWSSALNKLMASRLWHESVRLVKLSSKELELLKEI